MVRFAKAHHFIRDSKKVKEHLPHLIHHQLMIQPFLVFNQRLVRAVLDDFSFVEYYKFIGLCDGGVAVGDDYGRAAIQEFVEGVLD